VTKTALVNRRSLLKGGLAVGAALAVASVASLPKAGAGFVALSVGEAAVVGAVAEAMFPGDPFPVDGIEADVVTVVDRFVATNLPAVHAEGFRLMLTTLEWGTLASRGARFSQLDRDTRTEVLRVWAEPGVLPRRVAMDALKAIMGMAYFSHPRVQARMGWRAECAGGLA
jgi:hypothetical protein